MTSNILFFLHIPRTAGTTLDSILFNNLSSSQILKIYTRDDYDKYRFLDQDELAKIRYITGHLLLEHYDPPQIYGQRVQVITFLRDPVERLFSEYLFYKTWPKQHLYYYLNENKISFLDYLESEDRMLRWRGKNFMTRSISGKGFASKKNPLAALAFAKRQLEKNFLFFGLTERFNESILLLGKKIEINNLFHEQRNKLSKDSKRSMTPEERARAEELNQADRSLYTFACELFDERIREAGSVFSELLKKFTVLNKHYQNISQNLYTEQYDSSNEKIVFPKQNIW